MVISTTIREKTFSMKILSYLLVTCANVQATQNLDVCMQDEQGATPGILISHLENRDCMLHQDDDEISEIKIKYLVKLKRELYLLNLQPKLFLKSGQSRILIAATIKVCCIHIYNVQRFRNDVLLHTFACNKLLVCQ